MTRLGVALLACMLLAGCAASEGAKGGGDTGSVGFTVGTGTVTILQESEREPAPTLEGPSLQDPDKLISSKEYAGRTIVINVWGSWCAPCRHEAPELVQADRELGEDVQFLGLNTRDLSEAPARAFVRNFGLEYPNIFDPDGTLLLGFGQLPPKAIPSTIVIDAQGRVAARVIGEVDKATLIGIVGDVQ